MNIFKKAIKELKDFDDALTECRTPEYRKPTPPPPPTSGSNAFTSNLNYVSLASVKRTCTYSTPCGWCIKWDKKCDKRIGCDSPSLKIPESEAQRIIDYVNAGKLPPLNIDNTHGLERTK